MIIDDLITFFSWWFTLSFILAIPVGRFCATNVYDE